MARKVRKKCDPNSPAAILRREKAAANRSKHDGKIMEAVKMLEIAAPVKEFQFHKTRKWRFDFAWPDQKVAIEVNGGGRRGRHNTVKGATNDAEKLNAAIVWGWKVLVYTVASVKNVEQIAADLRALMKGGRE